MTDRVVSPKAQDADAAFDTSLRPRRLDDYIGQEKLKENLRIFIDAARARGEPLDHLLLYGPPGLGKTTLAGIVANEMDVQIKITSGPAITIPGDLASILTERPEGRRRLHRRDPPPEPGGRGGPLPRDGGLRLGHDPRQGHGRQEPSVSVCRASRSSARRPATPSSARRCATASARPTASTSTTRRRSRRSSGARPASSAVEIDDEGAGEIARRCARHAASRQPPAQARPRLRPGQGRWPDQREPSPNEALTMLEVDQLGLDEIDRRLLLGDHREVRAAGRSASRRSAASISEETDTVMDVYEPLPAAARASSLERRAAASRPAWPTSTSACPILGSPSRWRCSRRSGPDRIGLTRRARRSHFRYSSSYRRKDSLMSCPSAIRRLDSPIRRASGRSRRMRVSPSARPEASPCWKR